MHSSPDVTAKRRFAAVILIASMLASLMSLTVATPTSANHVSASDFFIFAKAVYGKAAETDCDGSQGNQASIQGSDNEIFGRIHSNADYNASGQNNEFHGVVTYGTNDTDCLSDPGDNDYNAGAPTEIVGSPAGVGTGGWPGTLGNGLNADALTFGTDVTQVLGAGAACDEGTLTTSTDNVLDPVSDNNKVICSGSGKVSLNVQNATMKVTIISHGLIEISGQTANLTPADAGHGILGWTDQDSNAQEFSIKVAGSNFHIGPSILFTPRSGQDVSGSDGSELCIQHIGQGQIKIQGSENEFGPGACGPVEPEPGEITIIKHDGAGQPLFGATFSITPDPLGDDASLSVTDDVAPDDDPADGVIHLSGVEPGSYTVCETAAPDGYILDPDCQTLTVSEGQNATFGPFVNTLSAIAWTKLDDETGLKLCCATFTLEGISGTVFGPITVVDNGLNDEDPDAGELLVSGLALGTYRITETDAPDGYLLPSPAFQDVTLDGDLVTGSPANDFRDPPMPTLTVAKTPDGATPTAGDVVAFRIVTTNTGPGTALGATLFDDLPAVAGDWAVVPNDPAAVAWAACSVSSALHPTLGDIGQWLSCGPESIAQGGTRTVTVGVTLQAADCDNLPNTATADATNADPASDTGSMDPLCPSIDVDKTPDAGVVDAPGTATFSIVTTNTGDGEARDSALFDDLPEVANGWNIIANPGDVPAWESCEILDTEHPIEGNIGEWLSCGPETIAAGLGNQRTVTVSATVTPADCGDLPNLAKVSTSNDGTDEDPGEIHVQCPDLDITKEADEPTVNAGEQIGFSIVVSNSAAPGTGTAVNVTLDDPLPGSLALGVDWDIDAVLFNGEPVADQTLCSITGSPAAETLVCDFGDLAAGDDYEVQLSSGTSAPDGCQTTTLTNVEALAEADNHPDITASAAVTVECPDLDITKDADDSTVNAGDDIGFSITVSNSDAPGTGTAVNVTLDDPLPGSLALGVDWDIDAVRFNGVEVENQTLCEITGSPASETLVCDFGDLAAGDDYEVQLSSGTSAPDGCQTTTLTNVEALAEADNHPDITASAAVTVECPDLDITKITTTPVINAGETASYSITIDNDGDGDAVGVDLVDELPAGISWTENSDDCSITGNDLSCLDLTIPAGGSFSVTVTGTADQDECPSILNRATFTSGNAGSGASAPEGQGTLITVNCPDLEVDKEWVDAQGAPTTDPVTAGATAYFAITVTNHGPGTAFDVDVLDFAPDGTIWTVVDDGGFDCPAMIDDVGDSCTADEMVPGSATIVLSYLTGPEDCGSLVNQVEVSAGNEPSAVVDELNEDEATAIVECPGLNIVKLADASPIDAGEEASFHILIWNEGPGDALDAEWFDELPQGVTWNFELINEDDDDGCGSASGGMPPVQTFSCDFGTLEPSDMPEAPFDAESPGKVIRVFGDTDRTDCGTLNNTTWADASNDDRVFDDASILVKCPTIGLDKANDAVGSVLPGTQVTYGLTLTVSDGPAKSVVVTDVMPVGLENPTDISDGGTFDIPTRTITWNLGDRGSGVYLLTYRAVVADGVEHGQELVNAAAATSPNSQCPDLDNLEPECDDTSTVIPRVPTLVIDKAANVEVITISGPANAPVVTPSVVTWTLTYTLAGGPVTNAVITDEVPDGIEYVAGSASDGGVYDQATRTLTWTFETLTESGSVTFETTVDPETISRVAPTVNVATIDSNETEPDDGEDSIRVVVEPPVSGGNPTPKPSLPDTAVGFGPGGQPVTVPVELLAMVFLGSLGALAFANVRSRRERP